MNSDDIIKPKSYQVITENPSRVFKTIRLRRYFYGTDSKSVKGVGFLNYIRRGYTGYNLKEGDQFDKELFEKLSVLSEECSWYINQPLFYEDHQEFLQLQTAGNRAQEIVAILFPQIDEASLPSLLGHSFISIPKKLQINVRLVGIESGTMESLVPDYVTLDIPHDKVEQFDNTTTAI
jgi:hypothetical protein